MDTHTYFGLPFAQEQAEYLERFHKDRQQCYDDHKKAAERLHNYQNAEEVIKASVPRRGFFQEDSTLRALCVESADATDSALSKIEIDQEIQEVQITLPSDEDANRTFAGAYMAYNQDDLPYRDQSIYLQPHDSVSDVESLIINQPSGIARSATRDSTLSYAQNDYGALNQSLNTTLEIRNKIHSSSSIPTTPLNPQTPPLHALRGHNRDSTGFYTQVVHDSLDQYMELNPPLLETSSDEFGDLDDWAGYNARRRASRALYDMYDLDLSIKQEQQCESREAKITRKLKGWVDRLKKFR